MRKTAITLLTVVLLALNTIPQASAQAVERGTIILDPYYGFPLTGKDLLHELFKPIDMTVTGVGPTGARVEYMLADRIGVGIDFIYKQVIGNFDKADTASGNTYNYTGTITRTRIHLRINYHLLASTEELDFYVGAGMGTNIREITLTSSDDPSANLVWTEVTRILPFSLRIAFGARYFFYKNFGINAEIGVGGPLLSLGISAKF